MDVNAQYFDVAKSANQDVEVMDVEGVGEYPELNADVISLIFSNADLPSLWAVKSVSKSWNKATKSISPKALDTMAFGLDSWAKHKEASSPSDEEIQATHSMLPNNIEDLLNDPCPVISGKRVKDTHELVYIGTELTLSTLGSLAERHLSREKAREVAGYSYMYPLILEEQDKPVEKPYWVLMTKDVLGGEDRVNGSRCKNYLQQQKMVQDLSTSSKADYQVPKTLEAVAVIIARFLKDKTYLFSQNSWSYTRCEEKIKSCQIVVGGFASAGLRVNLHSYDDVFIGVAGLRKFGSWS